MVVDADRELIVESLRDVLRAGGTSAKSQEARANAARLLGRLNGLPVGGPEQRKRAEEGRGAADPLADLDTSESRQAADLYARAQRGLRPVDLERWMRAYGDRRVGVRSLARRLDRAGVPAALAVAEELGDDPDDELATRRQRRSRPA